MSANGEISIAKPQLECGFFLQGDLVASSRLHFLYVSWNDLSRPERLGGVCDTALGVPTWDTRLRPFYSFPIGSELAP